MKKFFTIFIIIVLISSLFCSCRHYEEGPSVSFLTPQKRITGTFYLEKVIIDEKEQLPEYMSIKEDIRIFNKNGTGEKITKIVSEADITTQCIEWEFDDKKEKIREREKIDDETWKSWTPYYTILKLTKKELWLLIPQDKQQIEYHYKKQ